MAKIVGTTGDDPLLLGTAGNDQIFGLAGNDAIKGLDGNDFLVGGGNFTATIDGGIGNDIIFSEDVIAIDRFTNPTFDGMTEEELRRLDNSDVQGGDGNDILVGMANLDGGAGDDIVFGGNIFSIGGGAGNDILINTNLSGGVGADTYILTQAGTVGGGDFDSGVRHFIVDGNISGMAVLAGVESDDIIEFRNVPGISSIADIQNRSFQDFTKIDVIVSDTMTVRIGFSSIFGDPNPTFQINKTDVDAIFARINTAIDSSGGVPRTITSAVSYKMAKDIDNLVLTGSGKINGTGNARDNEITGNSGNNSLTGGDGNDVLKGMAGDDVLKGGAGKDTLDGGTGIDAADYSDKTVSVAVALNNAIQVDVKVKGIVEDNVVNVENVTGGSASDTLQGDSLVNRLIGNAGDDLLTGGAGKDTLDGGAAVDTADYGDKTAAVSVTLNGSTKVSVKVDGVVEDSVLNIENLIGGSGNDSLTGDGLANRLAGGAGKDKINGAVGNDVLDGGAANDVLTGGTGDDSFLFDTALKSNLDRITDFNVANDSIQIDNAIFKAFAATGALASAAFHTGAAAHDADDRIIYNSATGALLYDSNGSAAGGSVQFATLSSGLAITSADFLIV